MSSQPDGALLAEAIGVTAGMYLGGAENLRSISVRVFGEECRASVWAELRVPTLSSQLDAISRFADVRDCYADDVELELRFGEPNVESEELSETANVVVYA